tara:strand:- start:2096 stop:2362 length:267 start_codon:yes stop_codon:yes gene_type:complete
MSGIEEKKEKALGIKFADDLCIGDLVTWKDLGKHSKNNYGIIKEFYTKIKGSRPVAYARVFFLQGDGYSEQEVLIIRLKLLSKRKKSN